MLRVGVFPILGQREPSDDGNPNRIKGPQARHLQNFWQVYSQNVTYVFSPTEEMYGSRTSNGSFDGVAGLIARKEADVPFWPLALSDLPDNCGTTAVVYLNQATVMSYPKLVPKRAQVLESFDIFTIDILALILLSNAMIASIILLSNWLKESRFRYMFQFEVLRCMLNQFNVDSFKDASRLLCMATMFYMFFFTDIYENAISADSSTIDYSQIVNSIQELQSMPERRVYLVKNVPVTDLLKYHKNPIVKSVFERGLKDGMITAGPDLLTSLPKPNDVYIMDDEIIVYAASSYCPRLLSGCWIGQPLGDVVSLTFYTGPDLGVDLKKSVDTKSWFVLQSGLIGHMYRQFMSLATAISQGSGSCFRNRLQDLLDDTAVTIENITLERCTSILHVFLVLQIISIVVVTVELCLKLRSTT